MMGEAVSSGNLDYFYNSSFDLADFGVHMNCHDITTLKTLIHGDALESFFHSLFPEEPMPPCEYSQTYLNWLESHYDNDTIEVRLYNILCKAFK